ASTHRPSVDAVLYFARQILPLIRARLPELKFLVVGSNSPPEVRALDGDGVTVVGYVPDLADYLGSCRLSVAPLRYGAGIKGKVAMSLAHGLPCVTSSIAAEGMNRAPGKEVLVADDPPAFADAVVRLYTDPALWHRLSQKGMEFVAQHYSPKAGRRHIRAILAT